MTSEQSISNNCSNTFAHRSATPVSSVPIHSVISSPTASGSFCTRTLASSTEAAAFWMMLRANVLAPGKGERSASMRLGGVERERISLKGMGSVSLVSRLSRGVDSWVVIVKRRAVRRERRI